MKNGASHHTLNIDYIQTLLAPSHGIENGLSPANEFSLIRCEFPHQEFVSCLCWDGPSNIRVDVDTRILIQICYLIEQ